MRSGPSYTRTKYRDKALRALINRAGSLSAIGRAVGVGRRAVSQWDYIPDRHLEKLLKVFPE